VTEGRWIVPLAVVVLALGVENAVTECLPRRGTRNLALPASADPHAFESGRVGKRPTPTIVVRPASFPNMSKEGKLIQVTELTSYVNGEKLSPDHAFVVNLHPLADLD